MIKKYYYNWKEFESDIERIQFKLRNGLNLNNKNIYIVSFYRGGLPLAVKLSNILNDAEIGILKYQSYSGKNDKKIVPLLLEPKEDDIILCVDDIYDTGNTMDKAKEFLESKYKNEIIYLALFGTQDDNHYCEKIRDKGNDWVIFPWE